MFHPARLYFSIWLPPRPIPVPKRLEATTLDVPDCGLSEPTRQIGLAVRAREQRPRFLDGTLDVMDRVAEQAFALRYGFHHRPQFGRQMVKARIDPGKRYFGDRTVDLVAFIDIQAPGARLHFPTPHEFVDNGKRIAKRAVPIRELDTGLVLHVATPIVQFESVDQHWLFP